MTDAIHETWPGLPDDPVEAALIISTYGAYDGAHHKQWVIDQMIRALTKCPMVERTSRDGSYKYRSFGESEAYIEWCVEFQGDPGEYNPWDVGIPP